MLNRGLISASLVDELHTAGKQVFMWTVNSPWEMAKFADYGVDGIISDDTKLLASTFRQTNR
jgi:glycerophosphoryl diester phosphodiesterase